MRGNNAYALEDTYDGELQSAANSPAMARAAFIKRTYAHVLGAVLAFVALEAVMFKTGVAESILKAVFGGGGKFAWIALMVAFVGAGFVAQMMAHASSKALQYAGLGLYIAVEAVIFLPILWKAGQMTGQPVVAQAGLITMLVFGGLTTFVFVSGKDFSFLGSMLTVLSFAALGLVIASVVLGFSLGLVFSVAMVVLAAGMIVYDTSNVMHNYGTDQHVGAALSLFASLATMFFYILRIVMATTSSDD